MLFIFLNKQNRRFNLTAILYFVLVSCLQFMPLSDFLSHPEKLEKSISSDKTSFKLFYANLFSHNKDQEKVKEIIQNLNADIVFLVEYTEKWQKNLELATLYENKFELPENHNFGLAFFSKFQIDTDILSSVGNYLPPNLIAKVNIYGTKINFSGFHLIPNISERAYDSNRRTIRRTATIARDLELPTIWVGDFNATPSSKNYKYIKHKLKFKNAMEGFGLKKTWSSKNPFLWFTIDHVLHNTDFEVLSAKTVEIPGSDHFGLVVSFGVPND